MMQGSVTAFKHVLNEGVKLHEHGLNYVEACKGDVRLLVYSHGSLTDGDTF